MRKDKPCSKCNTVYPIEHFFENADGSRRRARCKPCRSADQKEYYNANKDEVNSRRRKQWSERRSRIDKLKNVPCADCGIQYPPYIMDFDHIDSDKEFNIGNAVGLNFKKVLTEAAKCDIVCSNCHRERTHQRRKAEWL